jgi:hypothetical protein
MAEMRENVLKALLTLAEYNPEFREQAIDNPENAIRDWGFVLTAEEMAEVKKYHRHVAGSSDRRVAGRSDADIVQDLLGAFPEGSTVRR